jgi:hypothetical protein
MKLKQYIKYFPVFAMASLMFFVIASTAVAAGLFGSPQTVSRQEGGLNTAIGYRYHEDTYAKDTHLKFRQNEIYSQAAYGKNNIWEAYARLGISDLKIDDVFRDNEKFFTTLGTKAFYPINSTAGIGAFIQGTYYLSDFTDKVSRNKEVEVDHLWDIHCGAALQITLPCGAKLYAGPYLYYSEAKLFLPSGISDWGSSGHYTINNQSIAGGFAGADIPLIKGFRLNVEGQYSDEFSAGAAISYTY